MRRIAAGTLLVTILVACAVTVERDKSAKELATQAFEQVISAGNVERAAEFYHPAFINHGLTRNVTLAEDMDALKGWHMAFPDLRIDVQQVIAENDLVSVLWMAHGTNTGSGGGLPATGRKAQLRGITIWKISNGKITEEWSAFDQLSMLRQLGLAPSGGE